SRDWSSDVCSSDLDLFGNVRCGVNQCVFKQGNPVIRPAFGFDSILIPDLYVLLFAGYGKVIGAIGIMDAYFGIVKMRCKAGINPRGYPAFTKVKVQFFKFDAPWSCFLSYGKAFFSLGIIGIAFEICSDLLGFLDYVPGNPPFGYFIFLL